MRAIVTMPLRLSWQRFVNLLRDRSGIAATEFAVIVPIMMVLFFGVVEFSTAVAVNRKVTIVARTLSDLVSQNASINDIQLTNIFTAGTVVMTPYSSPPYSPLTLHKTISELWVDPATHTAKVQWSQGYAPRGIGSLVTVPTALVVDGSYLIYSEVQYLYTPTVSFGLMAASGVNLTDVSYTRPRQSLCVLYDVTASTPCPTN